MTNNFHKQQPEPVTYTDTSHKAAESHRTIGSNPNSGPLTSALRSHLTTLHTYRLF
ncbi:hypothetical protein J4Q44_G00168830 [Coregonus suidteri]|uniref:Uncharacterized protein n=1 Tax=Coregonus suidteri TaxID=861788 RepID=A0AAN8QW01_9TELE